MFFLRKRVDYQYLVLELGKSIYALPPAEAAEYFDWYMAKLPERVAYVAKVCAMELHIPDSQMDCSPESLVPLWRWFRNRIKVIPSPNDPKQKLLTTETELLLLDVGMYLGETLRLNVPGLRWTYYTAPRNDMFCNHPLLKGFVDISSGKPFYAVFEPIHMAGIQARKELRHASSNYDLLRLYECWARKISPESSAN